MLAIIKSYSFSKFNPIFFLIGLFLLSCSSEKDKQLEDDQIVARVGDRVITAHDFVTKFEFSFAPFRQGPNPRKSYLNYLINEMLIANEGYAEGFGDSRYVKSRVTNRRNNNMLQAFYGKYVHGKVNIPDSEIEEATKRASIKFRMMIWPVPSMEEGNKVYSEASKSTLEEYVEQQLSKYEVRNVNKQYFETDWLDFLEMRPELLNEIQDLELGETSKPIPYGNGYALFQVLSIQREPIKTDELKYGARRKRIEARLFNIQSDKIVHNLMDSLLTPMEVRASSRNIERFVNPLYKWMRRGLPEYGSLLENLNEVTPDSASYLIELKNMLDEPLIQHKDGVITVEDYFGYFNYHRRIMNRSESLDDVRNRLMVELGNMIKNGRFIEIAEEEGFQDSASIVHDLQLWEEKYTYEAFRYEMTNDVSVSMEEMEEFFKKRWNELHISNIDTTRFYKYENDVHNFLLHEKQTKLLNDEISKLKEKYDIWINEDLLNSLELNDDPKSLETSLFVTKNFTGERVVPDADYKWLHF